MVKTILAARPVSRDAWDRMSRGEQIQYLREHPKSGYKRFGIKNDSGGYSFSAPEVGPRQNYSIGIPNTKVGGRIEDGMRAIVRSTGYSAAGLAGISFANLVSKNMENVTGQAIDTTTSIAAALNKGIAEGAGSILKAFTDSGQAHNIDWLVNSVKNGIDSGAGSLASDVKEGLIGNYFDRMLTAAAKTNPEDLINGAIQLVQDHPYGIGGALLLGAALLYRKYRKRRQAFASDNNLNGLDSEFKDPDFAKFFTLYLAMGLNGALEKKKDTKMVANTVEAADRNFWNGLTRNQQIQYLREHKKSDYRKFGLKREQAPGEPKPMPKQVVNKPSAPAKQATKPESKASSLVKATAKSIGITSVLLTGSGVAAAVKENMPNLVNSYKSTADDIKSQLSKVMSKQENTVDLLNITNEGHEAYKSMLKEGVQDWTAWFSYISHLAKGGNLNSFMKEFNPSDLPSPSNGILEKLAEMKVNPFRIGRGGGTEDNSLFKEMIKNEDERNALTKQFVDYSSQIGKLKDEGAEAAKKISDTTYFDSMWNAVKDISPEKVLDNVSNLVTTYPLEVGGVVAVGAAAAYLLARRKANKNKVTADTDNFIPNIQKLLNDPNFGQIMLSYIMQHLAEAGVRNLTSKKSQPQFTEKTPVEAKFRILARRPVNREAWDKLSRDEQMEYLKRHKDSGYKKFGVKQHKGNGTSVTNPVPQQKLDPAQEKQVEKTTNDALNKDKPVDPNPQQTQKGNKLVNVDQARSLIKPGSQNRTKVAQAVRNISTPESMAKLKAAMKPEDYEKLNDIARRSNDRPGIMSQIMPNVLFAGAVGGMAGLNIPKTREAIDQLKAGDNQGAFQTMTDGMGSISEAGQTYLNNVKQNFDNAHQYLNLQTYLKSGKTLDQHINEIKNGLDNLVVNKLPEKAAPYIKSVQDNTASFIQDLQSWKSKADEKAQPVIDNLIKNAQDSYDHVYNMAHSMANSLASKGGNASEAVQSFVQGAGLDNMAHNASEAISNGASYAHGVAQSIGAYAGDNAQQIANSSVAQSVGQFVGDNLKHVTSFIPAITALAGGASVGHVAMVAAPVLLAGAAAYIGYKAIKNRQKPSDIYAKNSKAVTAADNTNASADKDIKNPEAPAKPDTTNTSNNVANQTDPIALMFQGLSDTIANDPGYMGYMEKFIRGQAPVVGTPKNAQPDAATPSDTKKANKDPQNNSKSVTAKTLATSRSGKIYELVAHTITSTKSTKSKALFSGSADLRPWARDFIDRTKITYSIALDKDNPGYLIMTCSGDVKDPEEILSILLDINHVYEVADNKYIKARSSGDKYVFKVGSKLMAELTKPRTKMKEAANNALLSARK